ncbi:phospholipid scramblase 2-like isoform X2 [Xenia sp. Carnegie-2017]|uniref:phospholipid scramblase 2-like isoform X2 n=1 Tax=Xenia sp. Carnegie-2017 TaxID=2897299 RepID=UPI001F049EB0|nr:phospholipid scramblase 2-like isoform X2 [Xenia sp. Carnegie-2017]
MDAHSGAPPGYPPASGPGYPPASGPGYPPASGPGYPPQGPQTGYSPPQQGYNPGNQSYPLTQTYPPSAQVQQPGGYQQYNTGAPVATQPGGWMPVPVVQVDCPPGLEYLTQIDQLLIKQQVELLEAFTSFETNNKYKIQNSLGQQVYFAAEDTDCCTRQCCGSSRPFDIKILDNMQREVIHLTRPLRCSSCCFPCCLQELEVQAPPGNIVGYVVQKWSICFPRFEILSATREKILTIVGPLCQCNLCGDIDYKVLSADGKDEVGKISKQWSGLLKEVFTDTDNFGITFPMDLDVKAKATMLGAAFLIDFMFFEENQDNNNDYCY